jgi:hypothetical protein
MALKHQVKFKDWSFVFPVSTGAKKHSHLRFFVNCELLIVKTAVGTMMGNLKIKKLKIVHKVTFFV